MFGNILRIFASIAKIIWPLLKVFFNPRYLIPMVAIWFHAPNPGRVIKDFIIQNSFAAGIFYGIMTAVSFVLTYKQGAPIYGFNALILLISSIIFLCAHALFILLFGRVYYPKSKRINLQKTLAPVKDLIIVWTVTLIATSAVFIIILLISK